MTLTHRQSEVLKNIYEWNWFFEALGESPSAYADGRTVNALRRRGLVTETGQALTAAGLDYCRRHFAFRKPNKVTVNVNDSEKLVAVIDMMRRANVDYATESDISASEHFRRVNRTGDLLNIVTNIVILRQN